MLLPRASVDPSLFQKGEEPIFEARIIDAACQIEQAHDELKKHEVPDKGAQTMAMYNELRETEWRDPDDYSDEDLLEQVFGDKLEDVLGYVTSTPDKRISEDQGVMPSELEEVAAAKEQAEIKLVDITCGYQRYLEKNMVAAGMDAEGACDGAWTATWRRLQSVLSSEGTLLAEVASFYDEVARNTFGNDYQPMEEGRGEIVSRDVCARTFYEVMSKHVPRAIIGRARDEWTGY